MTKKLTKDEFVERANSVHGGYYSYNNFVYRNAVSKGWITCPKHGDFEQAPNPHLKGAGCPICARERKTGAKKLTNLTGQIIIDRSNKIHNNKYEYLINPDDIIKRSDKIDIICPKHGKFSQKVTNHLLGCGCPKCAKENIKSKVSKTQEEFLEEFSKINVYEYNLSKVNYINCHTKVCIICPTHGEFWVRPNDLLRGYKCPKCSGRNRTTEDFIKEAQKIHGDKYIYDFTYINSETKIPIKCKNCGNTFVQKPWSHLQGHGCPYCRSSIMENSVENLLNKNGTKIIKQCKSNVFPWLNRLTLDFYLPDYNMAIECQGMQHFDIDKNRAFGHREMIPIFVKRDSLKYNLCKEHGIEIIYFTTVKDAPNEYIGKLFKDEGEMLDYIVKHPKVSENNSI